MNIPFHRPILPNSLDILYSDSIRSGWLTSGQQVERFESKLSGYLKADNIVALNSCTAALHLAFAAKGFSNGDKFIAPTYTFASTIECGEYLSMEPILVDCEKHGFLLDLNQVEDIIKKEKHLKAIIPMHYGGETVDMKSIFDLANKYGLFVLEDAAHAFEASSSAGKVGSTDFAAAFSFYANKNITTGGEGGAISTNDSKLAKRIKTLSLHGITKDGWNRFKFSGSWEYDITKLGYKYNLTDLSAAFGLWQMDQVEDWNRRRLEIVNQYLNGLANFEGIIIPNFPKGHALHLFVIRLKSNNWSISRNKFIEKMNKNGIGLAVHYKPIHLLSYYKENYNFKKDLFPNANRLFNSAVSLPLYPGLKDSEIDFIINSIKHLYNKYSN